MKKEAINRCIDNIKERFSGGDPIFYICKASKGARSLPIVIS